MHENRVLMIACCPALLKAIGHGMLVGFPKNIRVLYVEQLEDVDPDQTVLQTVLGADRTSVKAEEEVTCKILPRL